jgi:hypothetical protein
MFETNTASCGGFAGLSDSFAASLWYANLHAIAKAVSHTRFFFRMIGWRIMLFRWRTATLLRR